MRDTFEKPSDPQAGSPLLQLAAELKLKILRLLLKKGDIIRCSEDYNNHHAFDDEFCPAWYKNGLYDRDYQLSSKLLQSCQQLYHEGKAVLYQENTLSIYCSSTSWDLWECCVFGIWTFYPADPRKWPAYQDSLLEYSKIKCRCFLAEGDALLEVICDAGERYYDPGKQVRNLYPAISEFENIEVISHEGDMLLIARAFREIVHGKNVVLRCRESTGEHYASYSSDLEQLRLWQCKSLDFPEMYVSDADLRLPSKLQSIVDDVTSGKPRTDLFGSWQRFNALIIEPLAKAEHPALANERIQALLENLYSHAINREEAEFDAVRQKLCWKSFKWMAEAVFDDLNRS